VIENVHTTDEEGRNDELRYVFAIFTGKKPKEIFIFKVEKKEYE
jgi:hypothetical protein